MSRVDPYEQIAAEYYDRARHPTSANFREASAIVLRRWLGRVLSPSSQIAEVGCGDSLLMEVIRAEELPHGSVRLTDSSPTMLAYSERWRAANVELVLADASDLPFEDESLDVVVSVLGDPYNTAAFWSEVERTLRPTGCAIYTTPSHEWSIAFRGTLERAVFDRSDGDALAVASVVLAAPEQVQLVQTAGLDVVEMMDVPVAALVGPLSPKLDVLRSPDATVVTGYLIRRRSS